MVLLASFPGPKGTIHIFNPYVYYTVESQKLILLMYPCGEFLKPVGVKHTPPSTKTVIDIFAMV